ncbi:hypothetical protein FEZ60_10860 [Rhodococcus sp. MS16]|uniref:AAA family ATPase n=1 Tax=Rhodococcus sp. MS16 TaxID=2579941 RepID=UPI0015621F4E|nr:AAA family ATPase [Rhodococcus sp. MS16]NRI66038.1 hypothetical protein [Rhodococcus sp. MS16]
MTNRILITHLAFIGENVPTAQVEFGPGVTIIRGPSDTGKSFIADSIDYMLGGSTLRTIPQSAGYSTILLGMKLPDGTQITLARGVKGGGFSLYEGKLTKLPENPPQRTLGEKHDARSENNLSNFLLAHLDISGRQLRRNQSNEKDSLSFRDLARLCVIDENQIQSPTPPPLSGQRTSETKEKSALKMLLLDEDDSALITVSKPAERKAVGKAKSEVLYQLLADARRKIEAHPSRQSLKDQLVLMESSISAASGAIESSSQARARIAQDLATVQNSLQDVRRRLRELQGLQSRFALLSEQYDLDIERLDMVHEAGGLLGYLSPGTCPFCGAEENHQKDTFGNTHGNLPFGSVIKGERAKTEGLRADIELAMEDLDSEAQRLKTREAALTQEIDDGQRAVRQADLDLRPHQSGLAELIGTRLSVETALVVHEQIYDLEELLKTVEFESKPVKAIAAEPLSVEAATGLSEHIQERLIAWGFPNADNVRFDRSDFDIVDDEQLRSAHGKGVRAVLHSAFTLALADHCFANDLPHPGFVVLDSPLVTYKPPKPGAEAETDEESKRRLDPSVIGRFYRDLQENVTAQVIVMENTDPPDELAVETSDIEFTASTEGRWGFLARSRKV